MGGGKSIFRDLDSFIEERGDPDVREPQKEGNISSGDSNRPENPQKSGNIDSDDARPQPPNRQPIDPSEGGQEDVQRDNIPKSPRAPEEPQRRGNIEPREFNQKTGEIVEQPEEPQTDGNIEADDSNQPTPPQQEGNISASDSNQPRRPDVDDNIQADDSNQPEEARQRGNIDSNDDNQPRQPQREGVINLRDFAQPDDVEQEGNIESDDDSQPDSPRTEGNISASDDNQPSEPQKEDNIGVTDENQPSEPQKEDNIEVTDSNQPQEPETEGNIEAEDSNQPREPNTDDNIEADDSNQPVRPNLDDNIEADDSNQPAPPDTDENIESEDSNQPQEPDVDDNIEADDSNQPTPPQQEGNIEADDSNQPTEFQSQGGEGEIRRRSLRDLQPEDRADDEPPEPDRDGNIEADDSNQPREPDVDDNIEATDDNQPVPPDTDGNIDATDENEPDPAQTEGNIDPTEDSEPEAPETEGNIEADDESQPEEVQTEGNIGVTDENEPDEPQVEGNIESDDDTEPDEPQTEGNIEVDDDTQPEEVEQEDNIQADDENQPDELPGLARRGRRSEDEIDQLNEEARIEQFDRFFDLGRGRFEEPFILRRPEAGGGSAAIANVKQGDSRVSPVASTAEDVTRLSKFLATGRGALYNVKQQFLQTLNPRERTRIYDPTSLIQTASVGVTSRPGLGITRHLEADSGPFTAVGRAAEGIGNTTGLFDVPTSARFEDKLEDEAVETEFGEVTGSLIWLSPAARGALPNVTGEVAMEEVSNRVSGQIQNFQPLFTGVESPEFDNFSAAALSSAGNILSGYLFSKTYDPQGGPESEGREETDTFHPNFTFVQNLDMMNDRTSVAAEDFTFVQFSPPGIGPQQLLPRTRDERREEREETPSPFPFTDPRRTPTQGDIVDSEGEVRSQIQNSSSTPDVYFENRLVAEGDIEDVPVHRGVQNSDRSRGLPNYSIENEDEERINRTDLINRLEPLINTEDVDEETEEFGGESNRFSDIIPFRFWDIENSTSIVFRAFLSGISDNLSPQWSQKDYSGRPEQAHIYSGYSNSLSFDFQVAPFTQEEFVANWKKVNYLKGLTTPARYSGARGGGSFMVPPFLRLQIGDLFNDIFGYFNSLTISIEDEAAWEIDQQRGNEEQGRLPRVLEISVDFQIIPERFPAAGQKFYDAPFIDEVERGRLVDSDAREPSGDPVLTQNDSPAEDSEDRIEVDNAVETLREEAEEIDAPTDD